MRTKCFSVRVTGASADTEIHTDKKCLLCNIVTVLVYKPIFSSTLYISPLSYKNIFWIDTYPSTSITSCIKKWAKLLHRLKQPNYHFWQDEIKRTPVRQELTRPQGTKPGPLMPIYIGCFIRSRHWRNWKSTSMKPHIQFLHYFVLLNFMLYACCLGEVLCRTEWRTEEYASFWFMLTVIFSLWWLHCPCNGWRELAKTPAEIKLMQ